MQKSVSLPFAYGELHITLVATGKVFDDDPNGAVFFDQTLDFAMNGAIHAGKKLLTGLCKPFDDAQELQTEPVTMTLSLLDHSVVIDTSVTTTKQVDEDVVNAILTKTAIPEAIGYASDVITAYHAKKTLGSSELIKAMQQKAREQAHDQVASTLGGLFGEGDIHIVEIPVPGFGHMTPAGDHGVVLH
jgi:hypothetical protein